MNVHTWACGCQYVPTWVPGWAIEPVLYFNVSEARTMLPVSQRVPKIDCIFPDEDLIFESCEIEHSAALNST